MRRMTIVGLRHHFAVQGTDNKHSDQNHEGRSPPCYKYQRRYVCLKWTVIILLMVTSYVTQSDAAGAGLKRRNWLKNLQFRCECGENQVLNVTATTNDDCRQPENVPAEGRLEGKVKRTGLGGSQIDLQWTLPKNRSKISEAYLQFKKERKTRKAITHNRICFSIQTHLQNCGKRIICTTPYLKRRPKGLSAKIVYKKGNQFGVVSADIKTTRKRKRQRRAHSKRHHGVNPTTTSKPLTTTFPSCRYWRPTINLTSSNRNIIVEYSPQNPYAQSVEISVLLVQGRNVTKKSSIPNNQTRHIFSMDKPGSYRVRMRSLGDNCKGVTFIDAPHDVTITQADLDATTTVMSPLKDLCSFWHPKINASLHPEKDDVYKLRVAFDPSSLKADEIEVAIQENNDFTQNVYLKVAQSEASFKVYADKREKLVKALVRPHGCTDCMDFIFHGEPCHLGYLVSDTIKVDAIGIHTSTPQRDGPGNSAVSNSNGWPPSDRNPKGAAQSNKIDSNRSSDSQCSDCYSRCGCCDVFMPSSK